jgi:hypothetical protein
MENEILWKWELLCNEFDEAKKNHTTVFTPLFKRIREKTNGNYSDEIFLQLANAEAAWNNWAEIQIKLKTFVEENT